MEQKDICVKLELAKKLKEAGYPQESIFWWVCYDKEWSIEKHSSWNEAYKYAGEQVYSAPTASELGELLPAHNLFKQKNSSGYFWRLEQTSGRKIGISETIEANARARMWLYLKENND